MFGTSVTNFHHGSSMMVTPDVTDCKIWLPVTNKKLDKIREKKQIENYNDMQNNNMQNNKEDEESNGKPLLNAHAPEWHIAANSIKPHPGLCKTQSHLALKKLTNQDQNKKYNKKYNKNKKSRKIRK